MTEPTATEHALWLRRQRNNVRLAWALGAMAVALFLIALWKYRPL